MFVHYRSQAFVLKKVDRSEADQLFTVFSEDFGKLRILGKAIRKIKSKLRAGVPLFSLSEIEFIQGKTYKILTDAILIESFENIKKDLARLKVVSEIAEIFDQLIKAPEKDEKIWHLLEATFKNLNDYSLLTTHYPLLHYYFLWQLLSVLGYSPQLARCSVCQKKTDDQLFSFDEKAIVCQPCSRKLKKQGDTTLFQINASQVKILKDLNKKDFSALKDVELDTASLKFLESFSKQYLSFIF